MLGENNVNSSINLLTEYSLSNLGFLPAKPLKTLGSKYEEWEKIVANLPELNSGKKIRDAVNNMPLFDTNFSSLHEYHLAYTILTLMTNSYLHSHGVDDTAKKLPRQLAIPLVDVSKKLGIAPILTHAAVDLYNWELIDTKKPFTLDNIKSLYSMTGTMDESWFYLIMTAIEGASGPLLLEVCKYIADETSLDKLFRVAHEKLEEINMIIRRMPEKCKPEVFYGKLRFFLSGCDNGLIFEGVSDEALFYGGGSAAQSTLLPIIDAIFGVTHNDKYFEKILKYMPEKHVKFLNLVRDKFISNKNDIANNRDTFNAGLEQLLSFRKYHMNLVQQYIFRFVPTDKGTGGTDPRIFLGDAIKETRQASNKNN